MPLTSSYAKPNVMGYLQRNYPQTIQAARDVGIRPEDYTDLEKLKSDIGYRQNVKGIEAAQAAAASARAYAEQQVAALRAQYEEQLSKDRQYTALADQIKGLMSRDSSRPTSPDAQAALASLGARNYQASDLTSKLNFQVSDQQILDDINNLKITRLNSVVQNGNAQIAGITERLNTANTLLEQLPKGDPRRTSSEAYIKELSGDLASVQKAVTSAQQQITDYKPITVADTEGQKEITAFREFIQLPEERATQQLRQIDPESYKTAVGLGRKYRQMATEPLGATTTPQTEQLRQNIEQEALNQLRLGSTLGAEERRGYEQAVRAAQTARGNIFGLGPAVQEAAQIGAMGEQRKLARYGAAQQFLASGETTGAAQARDLALRDALTQARLGAAAGFVAGGPSLYNLGQARTAQQQAAFQGYVQANQPLPGQFTPQTYQVPGYIFANPSEPTQMAGQQGSMFSNLYGSQAQYQASTYGDYVRAQASRPTGAQQFGAILSGVSGLIPSFSFSK